MVSAFRHRRRRSGWWNRATQQTAAAGLSVLFLLTWFLGCGVEVIEATEFDAQRAFDELTAQCDFGPRVPGTKAHRECRDYLEQTLERYARDVRLQSFTTDLGGQTLELSNIIADFGPKGTPEWLLCAHWDSRPTADQDPDPANHGTPILGANDGASGVAVLLEMARFFAANPPTVPVQIVLLDGEDYGPHVDNMFLGSRHFAADLPADKPERGILLDMVGDAQLNLPMERNSYNADSGLMRQVWDTAERLGYAAFEQRFGYWIQDDHLPLIEAGVPTIDLIDFDYPPWHTLEDTPDKCSAASLYTVGQVLLAVIYGN